MGKRKNAWAFWGFGLLQADSPGAPTVSDVRWLILDVDALLF